MKTTKIVTLACLALPALASADYTLTNGKNTLNIAGEFRTQYATAESKDKVKSNDITVENANLNFEGNYNKKLVYRLRLNFAPFTPNNYGTKQYGPQADYAYAGYQFSPEATVVMGKINFGIGFDNQSSGLSPLTFAQNQDIASGVKANGISGFGKIMENFGWNVTLIDNYNTPNAANNDNRNMDYAIGVTHQSKNAGDANGYDVAGDFRYFVSADYARISNGLDDNGNRKEGKKAFALAGFFSAQNAMLHVGYTNGKTLESKTKQTFWTVGAGYLVDKTWRPAITISSVKDTKKVYAANVTMFQDDAKWSTYAEYAMTKLDNKANGEKDPHSLSVGLAVKI